MVVIQLVYQCHYYFHEMKTMLHCCQNDLIGVWGERGGSGGGEIGTVEGRGDNVMDIRFEHTGDDRGK